jgi:outer membrane protein assembly factor BamB
MNVSLAVPILILLSLACSRAEDRLVLVSASYGKNVVAICEANGDVLWRLDTPGPEKGHAGHHDVHLLPNGNILYHDSWTTTKEVTLGKEVVWEYTSGPGTDVHAFARLANGNTMIAESGVGRLLHVDAKGAIQQEIPLGEGGRKKTRLVRILDNGHYLVCAENPGVVTEYDPAGKIVWEYPVNTRVYGAIRLRNGNTLIGTGSGNSVIEVTPSQEVVWEINKVVPGTDIKLAWMATIQELSNGNFAIGNCHAGEGQPQIFEINRDKKVVWEFDEWELVGNGLACWEILEGDKAASLRAKLKP